MTDTIVAGKEFLSHAGVLGMKWGVRKKEDEKATTSSETKTKKPLTGEQKALIAGAAFVGAVVLTKVARVNLESGAFRRIASKGAAFIATKGKSTIKFNQLDDLAQKSMSVDDIMKKVVKQINPKYGGIGTKMNCRRATIAFEMRRRGYDVMATRTTNAYGQNAVGLRNVLNPGKKAQPASPIGALATLVREQKNILNLPTSATNLSKNFGAGARNKIRTKLDKIGDLPEDQILDALDAYSKNPASYLDDIFDTLNAQPSGSRGELAVVWGMGGGHSMAYEIVNGKAVIIDAQRNLKFETAADLIADYKKVLSEPITSEVLRKAGIKVDDVVKDTGEGVISSAGFTRLDNIELNEDYLQRWIRNVS